MSVFMNDVTARLAALPLVSVCMLEVRRETVVMSCVLRKPRRK